MGLSKSKQTQTTGPSTYAKPFIDASGAALGGAYAQSQPIASQVSNALAGQLPGLAEDAFTPSAGITAATDYNTGVLGGRFLDAGNPYLAAQIAATNESVGNGVNARFGAAGRTGSGANTYALGKALSQNETGLRYADYGAERDRMASAAALAPTLDGAKYNGLGAYLTAAQAAVGIPQQAAGAYAGGVGSLVGGYNTSTGTSSIGLGQLLGTLGGSALSGWASGGFK